MVEWKDNFSLQGLKAKIAGTLPDGDSLRPAVEI